MLVKKRDLTGVIEDFEWLVGSHNVTNWRIEFYALDIHGNRSLIHDTGILDREILTARIAGFPNNGAEVVASFFYFIDGVSHLTEYLYGGAILSNSLPGLTSHDQNDPIPGDTATFVWSMNDTPVTAWQLRVGTTAGGSDLAVTGILGFDESTLEVMGLPNDGNIVHATLFYLLNNVWESIAYVLNGVISAASPPTIVSPVTANPLTSDRVTFTWNNNNTEVTGWSITLGDSYGGTEYGNHTALPFDARSVKTYGLPIDGRDVYVRLGYVTGGVTLFVDTLFTSGSFTASIPSLTSPLTGTVLSGTQVTFGWERNYTDVDSYDLLLGSSAGGNDIYEQLGMGRDAVLALISVLPDDASPVYLTLKYTVGGVTNQIVAEYTSHRDGVQFTSPTSVYNFNSDRSVGCSWSPGSFTVTSYNLKVGTTLGGDDLYTSTPLGSSVTSALITGTPVDGSTIYFTLDYVEGGNNGTATLDIDAPLYIFPEITLPEDGSTLPGDTAVFTWFSRDYLVTSWDFSLGSTYDGTELYESGNISSSLTGATVADIPETGSTVYGTLNYVVEGISGTHRTTYDEFFVTEPNMTNPTDGSTLQGSTVTFTWSGNDRNVLGWKLVVSDLTNSEVILDTGNLGGGVLSQVVNNIPVTTENIGASLTYTLGTSEVTIDKTYTAHTRVLPAITGPVNNSVLVDEDIAVTWSPNEVVVANYRLVIGSTDGGNELYDSGVLGGSVTIANVTGLPTDGSTMYATLSFSEDGTLYVDKDSLIWTALSTVTPHILLPTEVGTVNTTEATFVWSPGTFTVSAWELHVGTVGDTDLYLSSGLLAHTTTSILVSDLPFSGESVRAELFYTIGGTTSSVVYDFTMFTATLPAITSPALVLTDSEIEFEWSPNQVPVDSWRLVINDTDDNTELYDSGVLGASVMSRFVIGLPVHGNDLHLDLIYNVNGVDYTQEYTYTASTGQQPAITSPVPNTTLTNHVHTFTMDPGDQVVQTWRLLVGTTVGGSEVTTTPVTNGNITTVVVTGLPVGGQAVYVTLSSTVGGVTGTKTYGYVAFTAAPPAISDPVAGSSLDGSSDTFTIDPLTFPVHTWKITAGSSVSLTDYYDGPDVLIGTATTITATGLPTDGSTVHVRLYYKVQDGSYLFRDYSYTGDGLPSMVSPVDGTTFTSKNATFVWSPESVAVTNWRFIADNPSGTVIYLDSGVQSDTYTTVTLDNLPTHGETVRVRLTYTSGGVDTELVYSYVATVINLDTPEMLDPNPSSYLTSGTHTFTWTPNVTTVTKWDVYVGTSVGDSTYFRLLDLPAGLSTLVIPGLPTHGETIYFRLAYTLPNLTIVELDYTYTGVNIIVIDPEMLSPVPGATLQDTTLVLTWTPNTRTVSDWDLDVGTVFVPGNAVSGSTDIHASSTLGGGTLTYTVNNLPRNGESVYIKFWWMMDNVWSTIDVEYTAVTIEVDPPAITYPVPGGVLNNVDIIFAWESNQFVTRHRLHISTVSVGANELEYSGNLSGSTLEYLVSDLPVAGETVYVRLEYELDGTTTHVLDYTYTAVDFEATLPEISMPVNGGVTYGTNMVLSWRNNNTPVDNWDFDVGTSQVASYPAVHLEDPPDGSGNIHKTSTQDPPVLSTVIPNMPANGSAVYVRFWYKLEGDWFGTDYNFISLDKPPASPIVITPSNLTILTGTTQVFTWVPAEQTVDTYRLTYGTTLGGTQLRDTGTIPGTTTTDTLTGIPVDGSYIYVRLYSTVSGVTTETEFLYSASGDSSATTAELVFPKDGSVLSGDTITLRWRTNDTTSTNWDFDIGDVQVASYPITNLINPPDGSQNIHETSTQSSGTREITITGIPTDGRAVYIRFWYKPGGVWYGTDYTYTAANLPPSVNVPLITSPVPGVIFDTTQPVVVWDPNGLTVTNWVLEAGSSLGSNDYYTSGNLSGSTVTATVTGLPFDGSNTYLRLSYTVGGVVKTVNATYGNVQTTYTPAITSPVPGETLNSNLIYFTWGNTPDLTLDYWGLKVSTTLGGNELFENTNMPYTTTAAVVAGLPTDGSTVYVELTAGPGITNTVDGGSSPVVVKSYEYTSVVKVAGHPYITSPANNSSLGEVVTFTWTPDTTNVQNYRLLLGTVPGGSDFLDTGELDSTVLSYTATVDTLGTHMYARLMYIPTMYMGAEWDFVDSYYQVTVLSKDIQLLGPLVNSVISDTETLVWTNNGIDTNSVRIWVGSTFGGSDIYVNSDVDGSIDRMGVSGLPTDGSYVYVRLRRQFGGFLAYRNYVYKTAVDTTVTPLITNPTHNAELTDSVVNLEVSANGLSGDGYRLRAGKNKGGTDYMNSELLPIPQFSATTGVVPLSGYSLNTTGNSALRDTVFVRLDLVDGANVVSKHYALLEPDMIGNLSLTSPAPNSRLVGNIVTLVWDLNGIDTNDVTITADSAFNGSTFINRIVDSTVTTVSISGLPVDGSYVYVKLVRRFGGFNGAIHYTFRTPELGTIPTITTPAPNATLGNSIVDMAMDNNGLAITEWSMDVGTFIGGSNITTLPNIPASNGTYPLSGFPVNFHNPATEAGDVFVRLNYTIGGVDSHIDYSYRIHTESPDFIITSPSPNITLESDVLTLEWDTSGFTSTLMRVKVGDTFTGTSIYSNTQTSVVNGGLTVGGLPTDGSYVYITVERAPTGGGSLVSKHLSVRTPVIIGNTPIVTTPAQNTGLPNTVVDFNFSLNSVSVDSWTISAGTTIGGTEIANLPGSEGVIPISGIPTSGAGVITDRENIFVRINWIISGNPFYRDYVYLQPAVENIVNLVSPTPNSVLTGSTATIEWNLHPSVAFVRLDIGTTFDSNDIRNGPGLHAPVNTVEVTGLPTDGSYIYLKFWASISGWYHYTHASLKTATLP